MCKMLLSINPIHVENILNGSKKYEFRKVRCKEQVDKIIIYATYPVMQVVAEAEVLGIIDGKVEDVWTKTQKKAGISRRFYDRYYEGKDRAIAYRLGKINLYSEPKNLAYFGLKVAPQSFAYV